MIYNRFVKKKKYYREEDSIQMQLTSYIKFQYPNVLWTASAGGMRTSIGTAVKMKRMGYSKGTPDLMVFEPKGQYHGLFVEIKTNTGTPSPEQKKWSTELVQRGYYSVISYGYEETKNILDIYLTNGK